MVKGKKKFKTGEEMFYYHLIRLKNLYIVACEIALKFPYTDVCISWKRRTIISNTQVTHLGGANFDKYEKAAYYCEHVQIVVDYIRLNAIFQRNRRITYTSLSLCSKIYVKIIHESIPCSHLLVYVPRFITSLFFIIV